MQILTVVIPKLEEWQQQGAVGQRKITQWTRYLTIAIALLQSTGLAFLFHNGGGGLLGGGGNSTGLDLLPDVHAVPRAARRAHAHRRHRPADVDGRAHHPARHRQRHVAADLRLGRELASRPPAPGSTPRRARRSWSSCSLLAIVLLVAIVFIEQGQRRIPVQFAKRVVGRRMYGGQSTYIPLKVNQSGVIPIIFASSVLYLPLLLTNVLPADGWGAAVQRWINDNLVQPDSIFYMRHLRPADHRLRVLLHGDHVRPGPAGRQHPQAGRLHPRHPARAPDRALPRPRSSPASRCPARCSSPSSPCCRRSCWPSPTCRTSRSPAPRSSSPSASPSRR